MRKMIGYKAAGARYSYIVTLEIDLNQPNNLNRTGLLDPNYAKYRCKCAKVLAIEHKTTGKNIDVVRSGYNTNFLYKVGETITEENYTEDSDQVCGNGIHFFLTKNQAKFYRSLIDGECLRWYTNGALFGKSCYENGQLNGPSTTYYLNNNKMSECIYKDGKIHGKKTSYYYNGNVRSETNYENGIKTGTYNTYTKNGDIYEKFTYDNDKLHGGFERWHLNGKKWTEGAYECGKKHGKFQAWNEEGKLILKRWYYKNVLMRSKKEFEKNTAGL